MRRSAEIQEMRRESRLAPLGRGLFGAGIVLVVLRGLTMATHMPGLPAFWYDNQPMWLILGLILISIGWMILWRQPQVDAERWQPTEPGRRFRTAVLHTKEGCHLCDDAAALLHQYREWIPEPQLVDIESHPMLLEQFSTCVPVVVLDGKIRFRGRIQETLLQRLIEGTPPIDAV